LEIPHEEAFQNSIGIEKQFGRDENLEEEFVTLSAGLDPFDFKDTHFIGYPGFLSESKPFVKAFPPLPLNPF